MKISWVRIQNVPHEVAIHGGGLNEVATTGPNHSGPPEGGLAQPP